MRFIKVNELKLTQVELFSLFNLKSIAPNASELFWVALYANIEGFFIPL